MKVALISPCQRDIYAPGMRAVSAYLKRHGHTTRLIFLPGDLLELRHGAETLLTYPEEVVDRIVELVADCDLVGLSFLSQFIDRAIPITARIRERTGKPLVWGGIHATIHPEDCLRYVDMVCEGEGEQTMLELAGRIESNEDVADVPGLWIKRNGETIRNDLPPLIMDLDSLPFVDYELNDDWVYDSRAGRILRIDPEVLRMSMPRARERDYRLRVMYRIMSDRGCPHACSYCIGSTLRKKYRGQRWRRTRSIDNTIAELIDVVRRYPFIGLIQVIDDTFFARPQREIEEFGERYAREIGLPLHVQGSPATINEAKLAPLLEAGLCFVEFGIQTAHAPTKALYGRREKNEQILEVAQLIHKHRKRLLPPCYHLILDCPWEPDEGVMETLDLMLRIPGPFRVAIGSLTFFPGTPLHDRARREGLVTDEFRDVYRKPINWARGTYRNLLVVATGCALIPRWALRILRTRPFLKLLDRRAFRPVYTRGMRFLHWLSRFEYFLRSLLAGDFSAFARVFGRMCHREGVEKRREAPDGRDPEPNHEGAPR